MKTMYKPLRRICALLILALLSGGMPGASAESFQAVVSVDSMKVYAQAAPHAQVGTLARGTTVTVNAWSGEAALITCGDLSGIARVSDMSRADQSEETGVEMVANRDTRVYQRPSRASRSVKLAAGTAVTVLAVNGNAARVSLNGRTGYMFYSHLSEPSAQDGSSSGDEQQASWSGSMAVVTTQEALVYERPDEQSAYRILKANTRLTLLAVQGNWGMVSRNGEVGFIVTAVLKKDTSPTPTEAPRSRNPFSDGSTEYTIYAFLTGDMGLNRAAAMGVMANMYFESGYKAVIDGDGGTSYGLCQWHAGRKSNLINWCNENGLDYNTVEGQLKFLQYELPTRYPSVDSYIRQVENSAEGAYDAAYYFCFNFEAPAARTSQSKKRGEYARDTLWPKG